MFHRLLSPMRRFWTEKSICHHDVRMAQNVDELRVAHAGASQLNPPLATARPL
jgi:hypothetical protein